MGGIERFIADLEELGFPTERRGNLVVVELDVSHPADPNLNEVATDPPPDFPNVPPHWLHLHESLALEDEQGRDSELGGTWRKWSRKHPNWRGGHRAIQAWLAQARSLLLSAKLR